MAPILVGIVPFGLVSGVSAVGVGISPWLAQAMAALVFAGSAQLAGVQLIAANAPVLVILATTAVINLRMAMYSAAMALQWPDLPARWKLPLAYLLTDQAFAVSVAHYQAKPDAPHKVAYFVGAGLAMWGTWQVATALGIFMAAELPPGWPLEFAIPLTFMVMMSKGINDRATGTAALVAGLVAVLAKPLPYNLGLIVAALVGIVVGLWAERRRS
jgi:predicted branched-subunit amino acid permease